MFSKICVNSNDNALPFGLCHPPLIVHGGASFDKNIVGRENLYVMNGNITTSSVNSLASVNSDRIFGNTVATHQISEVYLGHGIQIIGNINVSEGGFSGNIYSNVIMKQNANVFGKLTVTGDTYFRGNIEIEKTVSFDHQKVKTLAADEIILNNASLINTIRALESRLQQQEYELNLLKGQFDLIKKSRYLDHKAVNIGF